MTDLLDSEPVHWDEELDDARRAITGRVRAEMLRRWETYCEDVALIYLEDARAKGEELVDKLGLPRAQVPRLGLCPCSACYGTAEPEHAPPRVLMPSGMPSVAGAGARLCPRCITRTLRGDITTPAMRARRRAQELSRARVEECLRADDDPQCSDFDRRLRDWAKRGAKDFQLELGEAPNGP